ncbi:DNA breaking-rejoining enzyme [Vibrio phage 1.101.O._10N.261.45.C6]|nr:DNA breaking-rejoining enzyme [Vibrio phage 1.101.O._10N.261.45.C6]
MNNVLRISNFKQQKPVITNVFANYMDEAWSDNTSKALRQAWSVFERHCTTCSVETLPASVQTVSEYINRRSKVVHRNTLKADVWAISRVHTMNGMEDPTKSQIVRDTLRAANRSKVRGEEKITQANGIEWETLKGVIGELTNSDKVIDVRDAAIFATTYAGFLRSNELLGIKMKHLSLDHVNPHIILPFTKTNHSGDADVVAIPQSVVEVLKKWISVREETQDEEEYLFTSVNRYNKSNLHKRGLKYQAILSVFKKHSVDEQEWTTHSCRVGAAQRAIKSGMQTNVVMKMGRWKKESQMLSYAQGYQLDNTEISKLMQ